MAVVHVLLGVQGDVGDLFAAGDAQSAVDLAIGALDGEPVEAREVEPLACLQVVNDDEFEVP